MLRSDRLRLRAVEPEDLDLMYLIENDTELWPHGQTSVPYSHYALKQFIADSTHDFFRDLQLRLVIETSEGISAGFADLQNYAPLHRRAEVGIVVVPGCQRKGLATEALCLLTQYAFSRLGIHQLYALVSEGHVASEALFHKCGYRQTAILRDWLRSPEGWQNAVVFQKEAPPGQTLSVLPR